MKISPSLLPLAVPISSLTPDPKNARRHGTLSIKAIEASLSQFGQLKPVVVRKGVVVAGHGMLEAAQRLGWERIAAVETEGLTADQARAYGIMDNRSAELSEWDFSGLEDAFRTIDAGMLEFTGFEDEDIHAALEMKLAPFAAVRVPISDLRPHPKNYRVHVEDELAHIIANIQRNGFYRNVVIARDGTILAGHGVVEAARRMGRASVPVVRLNLDPDDPAALKVMASDNEIGKLAEVDDRKLTEMLKSIMETEGLEGSGLDAMQLAALTMVTRPASEIANIDEAAHYLGMPAFEARDGRVMLMIKFVDEEARAEFVKLSGVGLQISRPGAMTWSGAWPAANAEKEHYVRDGIGYDVAGEQNDVAADDDDPSPAA